MWLMQGGGGVCYLVVVGAKCVSMQYHCQTYETTKLAPPTFPATTTRYQNYVYQNRYSVPKNLMICIFKGGLTDIDKNAINILFHYQIHIQMW